MQARISFLLMALGLFSVANQGFAAGAFQHFPYLSNECTQCHKADATGGVISDQFTAEQPALCYACHDSMGGHKYQHEGFESSKCTDCHNPHESDQLHLLNAPVKQLCNSCHDKVGEDVKFPHKPVDSARACVTCHGPHGSEFPKLLPNEINPTCLKCHASVKAKMEAAVTGGTIHPAIAQGCQGCHSPHGSNNPKTLKRSFPETRYTRFEVGQYQTCFECHKGDNFLNKQAAKTESRFKDQKSGKNLHFIHVVRGMENGVDMSKSGRTCSFCHEPHATTQQHLIRNAFPYGNAGFNIRIEYQKNADGGTCTHSCHEARSYKF